MGYGEFARRLCCQRNSLYYLFSQKSIDVDKLVRISEILGFDFLSLYRIDGISLGSVGADECGGVARPDDGLADGRTSAAREGEKFAIVRLSQKEIDLFVRNWPSARIVDLP